MSTQSGESVWVVATSVQEEKASPKSVLAAESSSTPVTPAVAKPQTVVAAVGKEPTNVVPADAAGAPQDIGFMMLFGLFLSFGFRAFGGPVVQIDMMRQYFVIENKWVSQKRYNRVLAVYQALPGPEATELACYFGYIARGRFGAFVAGMGFVLPGFGLMMLASWIYRDYGLKSVYFLASLTAIQPAVVAFVFRAVHKITLSTITIPAAEMAKRKARAARPKPRPMYPFVYLDIDMTLAYITVASAILQIASVPFYITFIYSILISGIMKGTSQCCNLPPAEGGPESSSSSEPTHSAVAPSAVASPAAAAVPEVEEEEENDYTYLPIRAALAALATALLVMGFALYVVYVGTPSAAFGAGRLSQSEGLAGGIYLSVFVVGLIGGLLTFGGAYTAIPMVRAEAVTIAGWLTSQQFIDGLALGAVLPTPLVMFMCFVGFMAAGPLGGFIGTVGMFLPAFSFTIVGHEYFEKLVDVDAVHASLDGVAASVSGLIGVTALQLLRATVKSELQVVIFTLSLVAVYNVSHPMTSLCIVLVALMAGQVLFVPFRFND